MIKLRDAGAHYYRADFQVHTPRDTNWKGARATSEEERLAYSIEFVAACRAKQLHAVAITDHHDFVLVPYIRDAAQAELREDGQPFDPGDQLVVFPGLELTLAVPCQALLILDADSRVTNYPGCSRHSRSRSAIPRRRSSPTS